MAWTPAVSIGRSIWISKEWADSQCLLSSLVTWACQLPASRWTLRTWDDETCIGRQETMATLIGIKKDDDDKFSHRKTMAASQFLAYVTKLCVGMSGYRCQR